MTTHDEIVDQSVHESRDHRRRGWLLALATLMTVMVLITAVSTWLVFNTYHQAAQNGANLAAQVKIACAKGRVDDRDLKSLCQRADQVVDQSPAAPSVKGDKGDQGTQGTQGPQGIPGPAPSAAQVAEAVKAYCAVGACRGIVSPAQVQAAVKLYCDARDACQGDQGIQGKTGDEGAVGPAGPAGKDGKDGTNGTNGTNGADAFPFTFSFTVDTLPQPTTYTCIVQNPSTPVDCTSTGG